MVALPFVANFLKLEVPKQALGGIPLGFGVVVDHKPSECMCVCLVTYTSTCILSVCINLLIDCRPAVTESDLLKTSNAVSHGTLGSTQ